MGRKLTQEEFIAKCKKMYGDIYSYSKVVYKNRRTLIGVICPIHGQFKIYPDAHLRGPGCPNCISQTKLDGYKKISASKTKTTKQFVVEANTKHNSKYTYTAAVYTGVADKVVITCSIHGEFLQTPSDHLAGCGCQECGKKTASNKLQSTTEAFIRKAEKVHGSKYDYSQVIYKKAKGKVAIVCPHHGVFTQTANDHLNGCGCRHCRTENIGWTDTKWKEQGKVSYEFIGYKLYIVKCYDGKESFIKIGKTFVPIDKRFGQISMYYSYEVLHTVEADANTICKLERKYQRINKEYKYKPTVQFSGHTECFSKVVIEGVTYE